MDFLAQPFRRQTSLDTCRFHHLYTCRQPLFLLHSTNTASVHPHSRTIHSSAAGVLRKSHPLAHACKILPSVTEFPISSCQPQFSRYLLIHSWHSVYTLTPGNFTFRFLNNPNHIVQFTWIISQSPNSHAQCQHTRAGTTYIHVHVGIFSEVNICLAAS